MRRSCAPHCCMHNSRSRMTLSSRRGDTCARPPPALASRALPPWGRNPRSRRGCGTSTGSARCHGAYATPAPPRLYVGNNTQAGRTCALVRARPGGATPHAHSPACLHLAPDRDLSEATLPGSVISLCAMGLMVVLFFLVRARPRPPRHGASTRASTQMQAAGETSTRVPETGPVE